MDEDEITPADLDAYVEGHLGRRPDAAARVMEGLRHRDEIRLFLASDPGPPPPATAALGRRLGRALRARALAPPARGGLLAASLVALGWFGHAGLGPLLGGPAEPEVATHPAEVLADDAAQALRVLQLKVVAAGSAPGSPARAQDRDAGGRPPALPSGYRRMGAQ